MTDQPKPDMPGKCPRCEIFDCEPNRCIYDNCARPGCGHYRCEHIFPGTTWTVSYSKDNPEMVGTEFAMPVGCLVHDGNKHCPEFMEPER